MPLLTEQEALEQLTYKHIGFAPQPDRITRGGEQLYAPDPTIGEITGAAFERENMVVSAIAAATESGVSSFGYDENYDPFNDIGEDYQQHTSILAYARNANHMASMKARIDQEKINQDILDRGGITAFVAQMIAGVLDPTILIPVAGVTAKGLKGVQQIAKASMATAGSIAVQEAGLQSTQLLRTKQESINAMIGGAILGGALGGVSYSLLKKANPDIAIKAQKGVKRDLESEFNHIDINKIIAKNDGNIDGIKKDLSSAAVKDVDIAKVSEDARKAFFAGETIEGAAGLEKVFKRLTPVLNTLQSDFISSRRAIQNLLNNPLRMSKNADFIATSQSVEKLREQYQADFLNAQNKVSQIYTEYKSKKDGLPKIPMTKDNIVARAKAKINGTEIETSFMEEVGKAMRRNDTHSIPEVQKAAQEYRRIFDSVAKEAVDSKIWEGIPDRKTAESYFSRMFDTQAIEENLPEFHNIVKDWVKKEVANSISKIEEVTKRKADNIQANIDNLQINKFRKASFLQEQVGEAIEGTDLTIDDVKSMMQALTMGKPKKPQTLTQFVQEKGIDINEHNLNDLSKDGLKEFQKKNPFKGAIVKEGGQKLDDLLILAKEQGFYRDDADLSDFIDDINNELNDFRVIVRENDITDYNDYLAFKDLEDSVNSLGINPKQYKDYDKLITNDTGKQIKEKIAKVYEAQSNKEIKALEKKKKKLYEDMDDKLLDIKAMGIDDYSDEVTLNILKNIRGLDSVSPDFKFEIAERGPLKQQKFLIPDEAVEKFLINDADFIAERYIRTMGTDIELIKKFGSTKFEDVLAPISREYNEMAYKVNAKERLRLKKVYETDEKNLKTVHQILRGTYASSLYSTPDNWIKKATRMTMAWNYMRMLGGVTASSISDITKLVQYNGISKAFSDAIIPSVKLIPQIVKGMSPRELAELKLAGKTMEHIASTRALSFADMFQKHGTQTNFEKFIDASAKTFSKYTLINSWNNTMQAMGGVMSQKRLINNILDVSNGVDIGKKEKSYLAALGIDAKTSKNFAEQLKKHSEKGEDGFIFANTEKWDNPQLVRSFRTALAKDVESILIQKDIGDVPLFANSVSGKIATQFKSFMFASTTKTLLAGLQRRDAAQFQAVALFIATGALVYILKEYGRGAEPDFSPNNLIVQGIDRSGMLGIIMEANNIFEKVGAPGLGRLAGKAPASRYASRSIPEALFGPTLGTISNVGLALHGAFSENELTDSDKRNLRKLVPYNNLFYIQWLMNSVNENTKANLGY